MNYYDAGSLSVQLYDLLETTVRAVDREIAHYAACAAGIATPVLEVGVGTGRLAWPLAALGHAVVGIDLSAAMLERAEAKRAEHPEEVGRRVAFVQADMTAFDLGRRFDLITVPFRSFNFLATREEQERFLRIAARHLTDAGRMIIDQFVPTPDMLVPRDGPPEPATFTINFQDSALRIERTLRDTTVDHGRQSLAFHIRYRTFDGDALIDEQNLTLPQRWTTPAQMEEVLEACGLQAVSRERSAFSRKADCQDIVWTIRRR